MNHYDMAVQCLRELADPECPEDPSAIALAQAHATLALVDAVRKQTEQQAEAWRCA